MTIQRVLQPHVCCIGNPVAGNPTQFVMYRAAQAAGIDWRFFTSQVSTHLFETAFRGIQALGLDGAAVLEPFQSVAISLLDSVTESALALGKVNVARSDGNSWLGDNTLGSAIAKLVQIKTLAGASLPVLESAPASIAVNDLKSFCAVIDTPAIAKAVQLASAFDRSRILSFCTEIPSAPIQPAVEPPPEQSSNSPMALEPTAQLDPTIDLLVEGRQPVEFLILDVIPTQLQLRKLALLTWTSKPKCIVVQSSAESPNRSFTSFLSENSIELLEPVELMAYQAAADFHFWTGVEPSVDLIRDSLEEYLQW